MSTNQPYECARIRQRRNACVSSEGDTSETREELPKNSPRPTTQNVATPLEDSMDTNTYADSLANPPVVIDCDCIVGQLIKSPFTNRERIDQMQIIFGGRPTPPWKLSSEDGPENYKQFYKICDWISCCDKFKRLFCWPCLLFYKNVIGWDLMKINNARDLIRLQVEHETSQSHLSALVNLIVTKVDSSPEKTLDVDKYNQFVTKNRIIVSRFIHIICYLTQQKLPMYTDGLLLGSDNFSELVCLLKHFDPILNLLLEGSEYFSYLSSKFLDDLLESICDSVLVFIKKELANADYITVMLEEFKTTSDLIKLASILRYADVNGFVHERFIGFAELPKDRMIVHHVSALLATYCNGKKLAGLSVLGPSFWDMKNQFLLEQTKLTHREVTYVHSYYHNSLHTISSIVNKHPECELFFSNLVDVSNIFSTYSSLRIKLREQINEEINWNYDSNLVRAVCKYRKEIPFVLNHIEEIGVWSLEIVNKAKNIANYMGSFDFVVLSFFFLEVFSIDVPFLALCINDVFNSKEYMKNIDRFVEGMDKLIKRLPKIWENILNDMGLVGLTAPFGRLKDKFENMFLSIKDSIVFKMRELKYAEVKLLGFIGLLEPKNFAEFSKKFPMKLLNEIKDTRYMRMFDMKKLKSELILVYQNNGLRKSNIYEFHIYLKSSGLNTILVETSKLAQFIVTLPVSPALPDYFYSASSRIRHYLKDPLPQWVSSGSAIITIEKAFLKKLKNDAAFENYIIEDFSKKATAVELNYLSSV